MWCNGKMVAIEMETALGWLWGNEAGCLERKCVSKSAASPRGVYDYQDQGAYCTTD